VESVRGSGGKLLAEAIDVHSWPESSERKPWSDVCEFFRFRRHTRTFSNATAFRGLHVLEICPVERIEPEKWGDDAPADWGVFRQLFPEIGRRFVGTTESLYLYITALENWLFDEFQVVKEELAPRGFPYVLLSPLTSGNNAENVGNLVFECPTDFLSTVVDKWFGEGFMIEIEGYVMPPGSLGWVAEQYFRPDAPSTIRDVLSRMRCGFRVWPDKNGLDVFSDKLDSTIARSLFVGQ
jgi:hypothetical protein